MQIIWPYDSKVNLAHVLRFLDSISVDHTRTWVAKSSNPPTFLSSGAQFQKFGKFGRARSKSFHFQKITGTLKLNVFFDKFAETFLILYCTSKNNRQKLNSKLKITNIFFLLPKMDKAVLDLKFSKQFFWNFL